MSIALNSDELDDMKVKAIQAAGAYPFSPTDFKPIVPTGLSSVSSISSVDQPSTSPKLRPILQNPVVAMIQLHQKTEELSNQAADLFAIEVAQNQAEIDKLALEKQELLLKELAEAKSRATWSTLGQVAQYITCAGAIVVGASVGGVAGLLIGVAGVIGTGNQLLHDTNYLQTAAIWLTKSEELQHKYTRNFEMCAFFLQMGLGLAGGALAWHTGALAAAQLNGAIINEKVQLTLGGATQIFAVGSQIGMKHHDRKMAYLSAETRDLDTKTTLRHQDLYRSSAEMSKMIESGQSQVDEIHKAIRANEVEND